MEKLGGYTPEEIEKAMEVFRAVLRWIWQDGKVKETGMGVRATVVCWIFLGELQGLSLSELADQIGVTKQSPGRWSSNFSKTFNYIKAGMKSVASRESYRKREQKKREAKA